jgi:hemerythrin-like domain-containing protein
MSFLELLREHERLQELFLLHQEALLQLNVPLAQGHLQDYVTQMTAHMRAEEELLLPVYQRAGVIPGGRPEFFTGEHQRMREFLARFVATLGELEREPADLARRVIKLFDEEAAFKSLREHHDQRERNLFYPTLDLVTTVAERCELVERCLAASARTQEQ